MNNDKIIILGWSIPLRVLDLLLINSSTIGQIVWHYAVYSICMTGFRDPVHVFELCICLSFCLAICCSNYLSFYLIIFACVVLAFIVFLSLLSLIFLSIYRFICLSVFLSHYISNYLAVCLFSVWNVSLQSLIHHLSQSCLLFGSMQVHSPWALCVQRHCSLH